MDYIQARNYTEANRKQEDIWYLVIHCGEYPDRPHVARDIAQMFHNQLPGQSRPGVHDGGTSAHRSVDNKEIVRSVHWKDIAYAAPGANSHGIHWEQAGYAHDKRGDWTDDYSLAQMELLAHDLGKFSHTLGIPVRRLTIPQLKENAVRNKGIHRGIIGHHDASLAFGGDHTDPGPHYPWHRLLNLVDHYHK